VETLGEPRNPLIIDILLELRNTFPHINEPKFAYLAWLYLQHREKCVLLWQEGMALIEPGHEMTESTSIKKAIFLASPYRRDIITMMKENMPKHTLTDLRDLGLNCE
jgi:hypothetical protein